ncbi:hypothetical protein MJO57_31865 [Endozoicomonas sp. SCSIO W0465]|nr:hypothetical protein [Endozoicomonas sp. SCSIO W0465]USE36555.1 hypothetical protein MJO57_31865 [Endozoicomonas sp. SCSIO W0465]
MMAFIKADFGGYMQGCFAVLIDGIQIRPIFNQRSQASDAAIVNGQMQGCFATVIAGIDLLSADFKQSFQAPAMTFGRSDMQRRLTFLIGFIDVSRVEREIEKFQRTFSGSSVHYGNNICTMLFQNTSALDVFRQNSDVQSTIKGVRSRLDQGGKALGLPPLGSSTQGIVKVVRFRSDQDFKTLRLPPLGGFAQGVIKGKLAGFCADQVSKQWSIAFPDSRSQYVIDIRPSLDQHIEILGAALLGSNVQGGLTIVLDGIDIGTVVDQEPDYISMFFLYGDS